MKKSNYFLLAISILFCSCEIFLQKDDYPTLVKEIQINSANEFSPPNAQNIYIQELDKPDRSGNNVKFIAEFDAGVIKDKYLALLLNSEKVVLRDDGKGADEQAGDHKFSLNINENIKELKSELSQRKNLALTNDSLISFKNRSVQRVRRTGIKDFDIENLKKGEIRLVPLDLLKGIGGLSDQKKTLLITDLGVIEDPTRTFNPCTQIGNPNGAWTFGQVMKQMASSNPGSLASNLQVSNFVRNWFNTWSSNQTVNGESLSPRASIQNLILDWEGKSGVTPGGILDMKFAPFKLIAIVNRLDLRGNSGYGFSDAGEGRLVFNALAPSCSKLEFTIIFEYGINKRSCNSVKAFAQEWDNLNLLTIGSSAYNSALENITNQFVLSGTNPSKPNQNSINQIRSNEFVSSSPWELREFNLNTMGQLELVTVKQEPAVKYNGKINNTDVERLATFINSNQADIENNNYTVPDQVPLNSSSSTPTTEFLGGKSHTSFPPTGIPPNVHHWDGTSTIGQPTFIISDEARHIFSLNTCSGCHGGETQTFFTHIKPSNFGSEATLSDFLTGVTVIDAANRPAGNTTSRPFNDLLRRENDLSDLISNTCLNRQFIELAHVLSFDPVRMTH